MACIGVQVAAEAGDEVDGLEAEVEVEDGVEGTTSTGCVNYDQLMKNPPARLTHKIVRIFERP